MSVPCIFSCAALLRPRCIFGHCRGSNQSKANGEGWNTGEGKASRGVYQLPLLRLLRERSYTSSVQPPLAQAIRNNGVWERTRGLVQCAELWMLGKDLGCGKEERGLWISANQGTACGEISALLYVFSLHSSLLYHSLILSPSLLCLHLELPRSLWYSGFYMSFSIDICPHFSCPRRPSFILQSARTCKLHERLFLSQISSSSLRSRRIHSNLLILLLNKSEICPGKWRTSHRGALYSLLYQRLWLRDFSITVRHLNRSSRKRDTLLKQSRSESKRTATSTSSNVCGCIQIWTAFFLCTFHPVTLRLWESKRHVKGKMIDQPSYRADLKTGGQKWWASGRTNLEDSA